MFCEQISLKIFNNIDEICRIVRKSSAAFGGLQVILSGDFYQLPPVPDIGHGDSGEFLFSSTFFETLHHINLKDVKRQKCETFIRSIGEVATGKVSALFYLYNAGVLLHNSIHLISL